MSWNAVSHGVTFIELYAQPDIQSYIGDKTAHRKHIEGLKRVIAVRGGPGKLGLGGLIHQLANRFEFAKHIEDHD